MTLLLGILKVIGICVLCIVLFLILCVLAVLFVPLRYRLRAEYDEGFELDVRVTWLFHVLGVRTYYVDEKQNIVISLFGIPIWDKIRAAKKKNRKRKHHKKQRVATVSVEKKTEKSAEKVKKNPVSKVNSEQSTMKEETKKDMEEEEEVSNAKDKLKDKIILFMQAIQSFLKQLRNMFQNIKYTFNHTCDKIKECTDNITYYRKLFQSKRVQNALETIKKWVIRFWKNIRPCKLCANITFGMEDPSTVADILSVYSVLYPWIGQSVFVYPHFEDTPVKFDLFMKGRITVYLIAYAIWKYLFDKDIRYLKRRFVREEK